MGESLNYSDCHGPGPFSAFIAKFYLVYQTHAYRNCHHDCHPTLPTTIPAEAEALASKDKFSCMKQMCVKFKSQPFITEGCVQAVTGCPWGPTFKEESLDGDHRIVKLQKWVNSFADEQMTVVLIS